LATIVFDMLLEFGPSAIIPPTLRLVVPFEELYATVLLVR
jgi:hypothetical protein